LIVGALANESGVFVVGREREIPVDILPPLRFETLALLADVQDGQQGMLAQSYERNHAFAGRIGEGKDWAPILLSPELRDTEYGSLLNITDQLLKGWSNGGETKYENFPYSIPPRYPFTKPVFTELGVTEGAGSLTYNWNTKGVGFTVNFGPVTFLALNRTGALPVSYIPEGLGRAANKVTAAEDTGYNYFSSLGDPNLARVVQYAALYQIFSAFDVAHSNKPIPADSYPAQLLESMTTDLNNSLKAASDGELDNIAAQLVPSFRLALDEVISKSTKAELEDVKKEINQVMISKGYRPGTKEYTDKFDYVLSEAKKDQEENVKKHLGKLIKEQLVQAKAGPSQNQEDEGLKSEVLSRYAQLKQMPERYSATIAQRAQGWIHTPVVVVSWNKELSFVGGHNLNARVSKIKVDERLAPGSVSIDQTGALVINSVDVARVRDLARNVERNDLFRELYTAFQKNDSVKVRAVQDEIQRALSSANVAAVRPREGALQLSSALPPNKPPINKPPISNGEPVGAGGAGWGGNGRSSLPIAVDPRRSNGGVLRIKASENRFDVEYGSEAGTNAFQVSSLSHEDAVDVAALQAGRRGKPGEAVVIEFDGISEEKALGTLHSIQMQMINKGTPTEIIARLSDGQVLVSQEVMASRYNFTQAKVGVAEIRTLETGELQANIDLTVPTIDRTGKSISFTSELRFKGSTPRAVIDAVTNKITTQLTNMAKAWSRVASTASYRLSVAKYNLALARSLKRIQTRTKLKFDVKSKLNFSVGSEQGLRDIYIGKNLFGFAKLEIAVGS